MAEPTYDFDPDEVIARERGWWIHDSGQRSTVEQNQSAAELCVWMEHHNPSWQAPSEVPLRITGKEHDRRILEDRRQRGIKNGAA